MDRTDLSFKEEREELFLCLGRGWYGVVSLSDSGKRG